MKIIKYFFIFTLIFVFLDGAKLLSNDKIPPVVSVKWLKSHINNPHLVIIDVRKKSIFAKGHIRHAINFPVFKYLFDKNYYIPRLTFLKNIFSKAGINDNSLVVVYGNDELVWAARFYWIAQVLGHKTTALLNVGFGNWKKGELPISTKIYIPKRSNFIPQVDNTIVQTKLSVLISIGKKLIIDGRGRKYYEGLKSHAKRFGHIPTALNYPGHNNYVVTKKNSKMKSFKKLQKLYKNLPKNKQIILYCEDGADAAMNFLVLKKLGYKVSVYDGSWLEWGNDPHLPIVDPAKKNHHYKEK